MLYFPLLRTKKGELDALMSLSASSAPQLYPVLQVPPPDLDENDQPVVASPAYISKVLGAIKNVLIPGSPLRCFLDPAPSGMSAGLLDAMLGAIAAQGGTPSPVFSLTGSDDYATLYRRHIGEPGTVILRVKEPDLIPTLPTAVQAAMTRYHLTPDQVFVMLDAGDISGAGAPVTLFATAMVAAVFQLQRLNVAGIIIASAALPASVAALTKWVPTQHLRKELTLFSSVKTATGADVHFGDYATGNVIDAPTPSRPGSPKVRYTLPTEYEVMKGQKTGRTPATMSEQFQRISQHIVTHSGFAGSHFSWGDAHIHMCSQPTTPSTKRGNATTWVAVNTSHHLELVVSMLPSM